MKYYFDTRKQHTIKLFPFSTYKLTGKSVCLGERLYYIDHLVFSTQQSIKEIMVKEKSSQP